MNTRFYSLFCLVFSIVLLSQNTMAQLKIERKIIIENEQYYFFTIDEETQLATLHTGSVKDKIINARKFQMPIGRELNNEFNPLCFDINNGQFIGINWMLNSMNSRYEALKKFTLKDWMKPHPEWTNEDWAQVSFNQPTFAPNEPWEFMLDENNVLENCFFDLTQIETKVLAICNQGKMRIWHSAGGKWLEKSAAIPVNFNNYFSLVTIVDVPIGLVDAFGNVYKINDEQTAITKVKASNNTKPQLLIVDNDKHKTYTIDAESIEASVMDNLKSIIKLATEVTF